MVRLCESNASVQATDRVDEGRSRCMAIRAQAGDRRASEWLYRHFHGRVSSLMRRIAGQQDGEDLTQQCFLTLLRRIDGFAGKSNFWTWFYRLCVNEALQHLRKQNQRPKVSMSVAATEVENLCDPRCEAIAEREAVEHALKQLTGVQQLTLKLHFQDGLSYKDISEQLSIPMGTVGSRINQAKSHMAKSMNLKLQEPVEGVSRRVAA